MENPVIIAFVTSNAGKFATAQAHLQPFGVQLEQAELELEEIQAAAVADVAVHKAWQAFRELRRPVIVEDSGFFIDKLGGFPGPLIKHALRALGPAGIARLADQTAQRRCHFESVLAFVAFGGWLSERRATSSLAR
jgi:non-canonical purine NTP pyrophosphatase (RdgB/HAM1 family)